MLQDRKVSDESIDPKRSRDLYWSSEATEDEALSAMAAATVGRVALPVAGAAATARPLAAASMWTNSRPAPTS